MFSSLLLPAAVLAPQKRGIPYAFTMPRATRVVSALETA